MTFDRIKASSQVFINANIFVYHFCGSSRECADLLLRCEKEELVGFTSAGVLAETTHRLMVVEAIQKGWVTKDAVKRLKENPDLVKKLREYNRHISSIARMKIRILPVTRKDIEDIAQIREMYGLLTNDSINVGLMRAHGIDQVATNDPDYERAREIAVFRPGDVTIGSPCTGDFQP